MLFKYLISVEDISIGMLYDDRKKEMRLGGNKRFSDFINSIVETYAGLSLVKGHIVIDKLKVRYSISCTKKIFDRALIELSKQGISVAMVKSFNRLMR